MPYLHTWFCLCVFFFLPESEDGSSCDRPQPWLHVPTAEIRTGAEEKTRRGRLTETERLLILSEKPSCCPETTTRWTASSPSTFTAADWSEGLLLFVSAGSELQRHQQRFDLNPVFPHLIKLEYWNWNCLNPPPDSGLPQLFCAFSLSLVFCDFV